MNILQTTDIYTLNQMNSMTCDLYLNKISIKKKSMQSQQFLG